MRIAERGGSVADECYRIEPGLAAHRHSRHDVLTRVSEDQQHPFLGVTSTRTVTASVATVATEVTRRIGGGITSGMHFHPGSAGSPGSRGITSELGGQPQTAP
jgi:hypothetical protein